MGSLGKYVVVALIAFALGAFASSKIFDNREPVITVVTETDTTVTEHVDTTGVVAIDSTEVEVEPVTIYKPIVGEPVVIANPNDNEVDDPAPTIETKKYTGTEELDNGTIDYEIYADSLYAVKFDLTTKDTVVTNTTTITKTLPPLSRLYFSGGMESSSNGFSPQAASVGLMYTRRQKWGVGLEVRHDFSGLVPPNAATTVGVRVLIGLGKRK